MHGDFYAAPVKTFTGAIGWYAERVEGERKKVSPEVTSQMAYSWGNCTALLPYGCLYSSRAKLVLAMLATALGLSKECINHRAIRVCNTWMNELKLEGLNRFVTEL